MDCGTQAKKRKVDADEKETNGNAYLVCMLFRNGVVCDQWPQILMIAVRNMR